MPWSSFFEHWVLSQLSFTLLFLPSSRGSLVPLCFLPLEWYHLHIWSCWYFSQQSWFQLVSHPAWHFTWCTLHNLNKQGDNIQPLCTPFPILNQSVVTCSVLTVASYLAYRFLRRQVRWSGISISLRIFYSFLWSIVKGFNLVNGAEIDVFLEFPCFLYDPMDVGNLVSGSSAFSKTSLYIWKFLVYMLLKPSLKDFEHYFASTWNEHNCTVVWTFFAIALLWDWNENWPFPVLWPLVAEFSIFANILSAVLEQHHLLGFEIPRLEFHHLH